MRAIVEALARRKAKRSALVALLAALLLLSATTTTTTNVVAYAYDAPFVTRGDVHHVNGADTPDKGVHPCCGTGSN